MAEDRKERVDRELFELLNELRIVLPGAQVLFAFLLTLPFTFRFEDLTRTCRDAYFAAFLCTAVGTVLFDETWAAVVAGLMAGWIVVIWYVVPLWQRVRGPEE